MFYQRKKILTFFFLLRTQKFCIVIILCFILRIQQILLFRIKHFSWKKLAPKFFHITISKQETSPPVSTTMTIEIYYKVYCLKNGGVKILWKHFFRDKCSFKPTGNINFVILLCFSTYVILLFQLLFFKKKPFYKCVAADQKKRLSMADLDDQICK